VDSSIFEDIGLTKREIKVYLALLEIGSTTVGGILEKTQIPSSKIYEILNRLKDKSLVSYVKIKNKRHYQASDPQSILTILDEKRGKIFDFLPKLIAKQKFAKKKQSVEIFEGNKAIFRLFRNLIEDAHPREKYFSFTHGMEQDNENIRLFYKNFDRRRKEKKLNTLLLANSKSKTLFKKIYAEQLKTTTKVRFTTFNFPQGLAIFRNNIVLITWKENHTAIKIESQQMANQFKNFFFQLWKTSKK